MTYHLIGIGGIGMSALARILIKRGEKVQGSDLSNSPITEELKSMGVLIFTSHKKEHISPNMKVIYSSAVKEKNPEYQRAKELSLDLMHRSHFLREIMKDKKSLMVTGSHGKTTTSALLAHLFLSADKNPSFAIGGMLISQNTNSSVGNGDHFIFEGDESDGSFLEAVTEYTIVTSYDPDHMEFWKSEERLKSAFNRVFTQTKKLIWCYEDQGLKMLNPKGLSYGLSDKADIYAQNIRYFESRTVFDVIYQTRVISNIEIPLIGEHNVLNCLSVILTALLENISESEIQRALQSFSGVQRRMERLGNVMGIEFIDDYAHHPTEIKATLKALKKTTKRRLVALFEAHRSERFSHLYQEFLSSFDQADQLIVTSPYFPEGASDQSLSMDSFIVDIQKRGIKAIYIPFHELHERLPKELRPLDLLITLGAGRATNIGREIVQRGTFSCEKLKVALLFGGESSEHDISLISSRGTKEMLPKEYTELLEIGITKKGEWILGSHAYDLLKKGVVHGGNKVPINVLEALYQQDVIIPMLHGPKGEDGMVQGFLKTLGVAHTGADYQSCALAMNKSFTKAVAIQAGIKTARYIDLTKGEWELDPKSLPSLTRHLSYPLWVKACHLGSSIGVIRTRSKEELLNAVGEVFTLDTHLIIEEEVQGRQIEVALLGEGKDTTAFYPGEILSHGEFYDYEKKYGENKHSTSLAAELTSEQAIEVMALAKRVYQKVALSSYARIDFFLTEAGEFMLNEINPLPGMTEISLFPLLCNEGGMKPKELMERLMVEALYEKAR